MAEAEPALAADLAPVLAAIERAARDLALGEEPAAFAAALEREAPAAPDPGPGSARP